MELTSHLQIYSASICDLHFDSGDIIMRGSRKTLRIGAFPIHKLPKVLTPSTPRKPPMVREELPPKVRHKCHDDVWKSLHAMTRKTKGVASCVTVSYDSRFKFFNNFR